MGRGMVYSESHGLANHQPMSGEKLPLPWVFSLRPQMNAKPTAQIGKLRPVSAGRSQEPLCLPPFRGQSVCLSTHPSSGHYPPPNPLSAPLSLSPATPSQGM